MALTASAQSSGNEIESYYFRAATGYPFVTYSDDLQQQIDAIEASGASRSLIATIDLGIYWPCAMDGTLLGVTVTGIPDMYTDGDWQGTINFMHIGPGVQHFLQADIGEGFFLRLDPGMAMEWTDVTVVDGKETLRMESETKIGFGVLAGGGYAIPLSPGTRLTIDVHAVYRSVDPYNATALHIGLGMLW
jgi:hypothetical protein